MIPQRSPDFVSWRHWDFSLCLLTKFYMWVGSGDGTKGFMLIMQGHHQLSSFPVSQPCDFHKELNVMRATIISGCRYGKGGIKC